MSSLVLVRGAGPQAHREAVLGADLRLPETERLDDDYGNVKEVLEKIW